MTVLAQLSLNESAELVFGLEVFGTENKTLNARFIIEGPQYGIICKCVEANGVITASVPKLEGILPHGTYSAKLEVIVDGKHFQPLTEDIQFNQPMSIRAASNVKVNPENSIQIQTSEVTVRVSEDKTSVKSVVKPMSNGQIRQSSFTDYVAPTDVLESSKVDKIATMYKKIREAEEKLSNMRNKK